MNADSSTAARSIKSAHGQTPEQTPGQITEIIADRYGWRERVVAAFLRGFLRLCFRPLVGPPISAAIQRRVVGLLSFLMPGRRGTLSYQLSARGVPTEILAPQLGETGGALLYLHGGAFCLGGPSSHRSITTHLALETGMSVWVPNYRLSPEHPYPAALDDALSCYRAMIDAGYRADQIVVAGDSAGGTLTLALALSLRKLGAAMPAGLALLSPLTDPTLNGPTLLTHARRDPMLRSGWLKQALAWYACPLYSLDHRPLAQNLAGLPPMLIQVGDLEILLSDATRLADHARNCGIPCRLEIHAGRWHVFQLQAFHLRSAVRALRTIAEFARARVAVNQSQ
jgi:acetyl esterase/lipase